ncbi:DeoR/GlpR family DNA-binding transcription regulator [Tessaracoccus massiliensis]|uniref:DeoR/GlpR family DNA-binding transcription regulator n=1 Tax=Tessaracoccus massiliensis TaxID=1522311 RepID=UPI00058C3160|nr:DeoR/GlpR family DNA-binding transcription regulator [Tessaracoccus massiliensis]
MLKTARHEALLQLLHARGPVAVTEVSEKLGISPATVRRDITEMEERGLVERTWGGVRLLAEDDDPFQVALAKRGNVKQRIGEAAAELIPDGATVILDVGTTGYYVALALEARGVTVLTASLPTFEHLRATKKAHLIMLGGQWSEQYQCFGGVQTVDALGRQHADFAFLGCSGVADNGRVRDNSQSQSMVKRAILSAATTTYLLADTSKFPGKGSTSPFDIDDIDGLITDAETLAPSIVERAATHHTEITTV